MERWRSFFSKAGEDLWTIIEQAILLAAHDYPREFKEKRCEIAETLFARNLHQGDADATRLSASVVTNCTNRMDVDETRGEDEHVSAHTKEHTRHDAEQHHTELCSAEARNDGVDDHASISQVVCNIKETLDDSMQSEAAVLHGLQTLESLHISVDVLKATEIGKQVNNLRKHSCKEIRLLAKNLVRHWKEVVDDWVNCAGTSHGSLQGHATSERDNEEGMLSALHDKSTQILTRITGEMPQYCYYDDTKARENYLEAPEERGSSSRVELSGLGRIEKPQFKSRGAAGKEVLENESNVVTGRVIGVKASTGSLGLGRPSTDVAAGKGAELNRSYGTGKLSTEVSYVNKIQEDYSSQKQKQSRISGFNQQTYTCNEAVHSEEKLEASKRKPQEVYMQVDNAKRQQMAFPMSNRKDFPTGGGARPKTAMPGLAPQNSHWNHTRK